MARSAATTAAAPTPLVAPDPNMDPRAGRWTTLHRLVLVGSGLALGGTGAVEMRRLLEPAGILADPGAHVPLLAAFAAALLPALLLATPPLTPRAVARPRGVGGVIGAVALIYLAIFALSGAFGAGAAYVGAADAVPGGTFGLVQVAAPSLALLTAFAAVGEATVTPPPRRSIALRTHHAALAMLGIAQCALILSAVIGPFAEAEIPGLAMRVLALSALTLALAKAMPRYVYAPTRWYHWFGYQGWVTFPISMAAVVLLTPLMEPAVIALMTGAEPVAVLTQIANPVVEIPGLATLSALIGGALLVTTVTAVAVIRQAPSVLRPAYAGPSMEEMVATPMIATPSKVRHPRDRDLPAVGAMMGAYKILDWLVMRLLGLGALGAAYLQWQMLQSDQALVDYLGLDLVAIEHQMYLYLAMGVILAVPFVLPRYVARPHRVLGGFLKSLIVVAAAYMLLPTLHEVIEAFSPKAYAPFFHGAAPKIVKGICGVAITGALLISFFRQLGALPTDRRDDAGPKMPAEDLRALRMARLEMSGAGGH